MIGNGIVQSVWDLKHVCFYAKKAGDNQFTYTTQE